MITRKFIYPWGEKYVKYKEWIFVLKSKSGQVQERMKVTDQDGYEKLLARFKDEVDHYSSDPGFTLWGSHYFEVDLEKNNRLVCYIQGFLCD